MALTQVNPAMLSGSTNTTTTIQSNGTTAITIDSSQNVGIGTSSPTSYGDANTKLAVVSPTSGTNDVNIRWGTNAVKGILYCNDVSGAGVGIGSTTSAYLGFLTAGSERMRIDSSGTPMFNTTSQLIRGGETFRNNGGTGIASFKSNASGAPVIAIQNTNGVSTYQIAFNNSTQECGTITTGSNTVGYNSNSDYRLKEDVQPMTGGLDKVAQLKPVTYKWKADGSKGQGFIAHELQEVVPDCVTGEKDAVDAEGKPVYQGIDTSFLVATLTAAIQELNAKVTELEAKLANK